MSRFTLSVLFLAAACTNPIQLDEGSYERRAESTPEAFGVLALLNDANTTLDILDDNAALDSRAARSLIAHRNGPDRTYLTADDNRFDSMAEVDDQYYVGRGAIKRLERYAAQAGYVPGGSDIVGTWEKITFTMDEVTDTLALVNDASEGELDDDVGLNSRAVAGILDARPIATMNELADAHYVGRSAMKSLLAYVIENALSDSGESCDTSDDCKEGLVCLGELAYGTGLFCVDDTMYGTFSYDSSVAIPDNGSTLTTSVNVSGLATVPVDVVLTLDIDHPRPSDLVVTIDNFNG